MWLDGAGGARKSTAQQLVELILSTLIDSELQHNHIGESNAKLTAADVLRLLTSRFVVCVDSKVSDGNQNICFSKLLDSDRMATPFGGGPMRRWNPAAAPFLKKFKKL